MKKIINFYHSCSLLNPTPCASRMLKSLFILRTLTSTEVIYQLLYRYEDELWKNTFTCSKRYLWLHYCNQVHNLYHTQNLKLKVGPNFTFPTKKAVQHQDLPSSKMAPFNTRGVQSSSPYCTLDPDEFQNMISIQWWLFINSNSSNLI